MHKDCHCLNYHTRTIITRIYYSIFEDHSVLMYGQYSREVCIQERVMMACEHYIFLKNPMCRPVHCAVNVPSPEVSRSYSEKVHKLDSSEIFLLFSSFFLLFGMQNSKCRSKLYIPSTINTWRKLLKTDIWADRKWASFWQICLYIK